MNCVIIDDDAMSRRLIENYVSKVDFLTLSGEFESAVKASTFIASYPVDLLLLDVQMPVMSGIEFIRSLQVTPQIILITSHKKFAVEAFEYNVTDFLMKPVPFSRFFKGVSRAKEFHEKQIISSGVADSIYIRSEGMIHHISYDDILWIEGLADYVILNTQAKKFIIHSTMKGIDSRLPSTKFFRVHNSYIINLSKIKIVDQNSVIINDKKIPISRPHKEKLFKLLNIS